MHSSHINTKRDSFRQEIRRRQVEHMFAENRKNYQQSEQQLMEYQPANSYLMQRCLIKNQLLNQLPTLLPSLAHKISHNKAPANVEFVLTVSSNILLDSITLPQKQYIYTYCLAAVVGAKSGWISPLVQVYFYMTVMNVCYDCLEQAKQIQIEQLILPNIMNMLEFDHVDFTRASVQYSDMQRKASLLEDALTAISYFYDMDQDHNNTLLYKVKRTVKSITFFVTWSQAYLTQISVFDNFPQLLSLINTILNNVSTIPYSLSSLFSPSCMNSLLQVLMVQMYYQDEELDDIKCVGVSTINNLYKQESELVRGALVQEKLCMLIGELEKSVCIPYLIQLMKLFGNIVADLSQESQQMMGNDVEDKLNCVVSAVLRIIKDREEDTDQILLKQALSLLKLTAGLGYERGDSSYINFMRGMGMEQMLDGLYIKIKNQDIIDEIDEIYKFIDIC